MAWGGSAEVPVDEVVYEPLPKLDASELRRLRDTIGLPEASGPDWGRPPIADRVPAPRNDPAPVVDVRDNPPAGNLTALLADVNRKLETLIAGGSAPVFNDFFAEALVSLHCDIDDMRVQLKDLRASLDRLTSALVGDGSL